MTEACLTAIQVFPGLLCTVCLGGLLTTFEHLWGVRIRRIVAEVFHVEVCLNTRSENLSVLHCYAQIRSLTKQNAMTDADMGVTFFKSWTLHVNKGPILINSILLCNITMQREQTNTILLINHAPIAPS